jgi:hypothetical protein
MYIYVENSYCFVKMFKKEGNVLLNCEGVRTSEKEEVQVQYCTYTLTKVKRFNFTIDSLRKGLKGELFNNCCTKSKK